jgi:hypothetical protein
MAKFAKECLQKLFKVTRELEVTLGPDTGDLSMRFGLHSGAVTAGVLRGDRARFELFGGTVNTAARMERYASHRRLLHRILTVLYLTACFRSFVPCSTGMRGRIQVSQTTADLIRRAGKGSWVQPRKDTVVAKGLGALQTFWIEQETKEQVVMNSSNSNSSSETRPEGDAPASKHSTQVTPRMDAMDAAKKNERHVDWMTEVLSDYAKKIVSTIIGV